jgi:hypothetical protein
MIVEGVCWPVMILAIRRSIAVAAACGLAASIAAYFGSYIGVTMDGLPSWAIVLHIGIFIFWIPMCILEYAPIKDRNFFWKEFSQGKPKWVLPTIKLIGLFFAIHFVSFLIESHFASPQIKDGQYVLDNHGQILKVITQREYLHLRGAELRLFATGWASFYSVSLAYWWFPRLRVRHSISTKI